MDRKRNSRRAVSFVSTLGCLALLTACAGGAASGTDEVDPTEGFTYDASQSEVNEVIADLEPVTLTYQSAAPSENHVTAPSTLEFKEYIEERSNGQITIDVIWGTAVAGYEEIDDALLDGRLDLAYTIPGYQPDEYPVYDAVMALAMYSPSTPIAGQAATYGMMSELGWETDSLIDEFEEKGLHVLSPLINLGQYGSWCTTPTNDLSAISGSSIHASSTAATETVAALGGSPVYLEFTEVFEALQRNTVDCTIMNQPISSANGLNEVAPHMTFPQSGWPGKPNGAHVAGSSFEELPLAYKQIIFDAEAFAFDGWLQHIEDATVANAEVIADAGGSFKPFDEEAQAIIDETHQGLVDGYIDEGLITEDSAERAQELSETWLARAADAGLEDGGTLADFEEWYEPSDFDFSSLGQIYFEEVALEHRPGNE